MHLLKIKAFHKPPFLGFLASEAKSFSSHKEDGIPGEEQYDGIPMGAGVLELEGQKTMQLER